jgi:GT2 family glycosyltransferase
MLLRRQALDEIGLFDDTFFMYAEEVDWCYRARQRGWSVLYVPEARADHHVGASYNRVPMRRREQIYRSKWLYFRKHHGLLPALLFRGVIQGAAALKLAAWAAAGLCGRGAGRVRARHNVTSYRYLLSNF